MPSFHFFHILLRHAWIFTVPITIFQWSWNERVCKRPLCYTISFHANAISRLGVCYSWIGSFHLALASHDANQLLNSWCSLQPRCQLSWVCLVTRVPRREKEQIKFCFELKIFSKKSVYWLFQRFFTIDVSWLDTKNLEKRSVCRKSGFRIHIK